MLTINNASNYASTRAYIVYNIVEGEAWFFSAWDDLAKATAQAYANGLYVIEREKCELVVW